MMAEFIMPLESVAKCGMYTFKKTLFLNQGESVTVRIYASSAYVLYINDNYICEGPCKSAEGIKYFDTVKTDVLTDGENEIRVEVMHLTDRRNFSAMFKTDKPMLLFDAISDNIHIASDSSWECYLNGEHKLISFEMIAPYIVPNESLKVNGKKFPLTLSEGEKSDFATAYDRVGIESRNCLYLRPVPMIYPQNALRMKEIRRGEGFVEFDAGGYVTAKAEIKLAAHSKAKIIYAECYRNNGKKMRRDIPCGEIDGTYDIIETSNEPYVFKTFRFRAFRYIRIECDDPEKTVLDILYRKWNYPLEISGSFECSDENMNKMFDISVNTMLCCLHDTFMDCPYYEQQQYVMDSAIEAAVLMRMSSDLRPIQKCIFEFAAAQKYSGLIPANYPCSYVQIIPGFSFFWIFMLSDYLNYTHDTKLVYRYISTADKILTYFDEIVSAQGLIGKSEYWDYVDWVPDWDYGTPIIKDDDAVTIYNLYYAAALKSAEDICRKTGRCELASEYERRHCAIKDTLHQKCYDKENKLFRDGAESKRFSVHTIIWAILSEVVSESEGREMLSRLNDKDLCKSSFSMNYYLFRAMEKAGEPERIFEYLDGWNKMIESGCTTWCENPDNPRSECHGWSSAPLYEFSANILGIKPIFENEIVIKPICGHLKQARGTVPTRFGEVFTEWKKDDDMFFITVDAPDNITKRLFLPNGEEITSSEKHIEYKCKISDKTEI